MTRIPPILEIPPEIRELILQYLLAPDVITIQCAVIKSSEISDVVDSGHGFHENLSKITSPVKHRSKWAIPARDLKVPEFPEHGSSVGQTTVEMTYQIDPSIRKSGQTLELQLFHVCKELYAEANISLYRKKTLSFASAFAVPAAATFFKDRSPVVLGLIQCLKSRVQELLVSYSEKGDYPEQDSSSVLQLAYGYYPTLCEMLASPSVNVRKLSLNIEGWAMYMYTHPPSLPSMEQFAAGEYTEPWSSWADMARDVPASWMQPLLTITGLEKISVCWAMTAPTIQREVETVVLMRQHMLKQNKHTQALGKIEFSNHVLSSKSLVAEGSTVWYAPDTKSFEWRDDTRDSSGLLEDEIHRQIAQSLLAKFSFVRLCRFELTADAGSRTNTLSDEEVLEPK